MAMVCGGPLGARGSITRLLRFVWDFWGGLRGVCYFDRLCMVSLRSWGNLGGLVGCGLACHVGGREAVANREYEHINNYPRGLQRPHRHMSIHPATKGNYIVCQVNE